MKKAIMIKITSIIITAALMLAMLPAGAITASAQIGYATGDWSNGPEWWSQGQSKYDGVRGWGCLIVAQARMLAKSGVASSDTGSFNPDVWYEWEVNNGYVRSDMNTTSYAGPQAYASSIGKSLTYEGVVYSNCEAKIWENINSDKYSIIRTRDDGGSHYVLVNNGGSQTMGRIRVYQSWDSKNIPGTRDWTNGTSEVITYKAVTHQHSYNSVVTAPTCTSKGYTTHTCSCGSSYIDSYVDAIGHNWGAWRENKSATCTEYGEESRICLRCSAVETRIGAQALGHSWGRWISIDSITHERVCANDPSHFQSEIHSWDSGEITIEPTVSKPGIKTYTCIKCGETKNEILPKLGMRKGDPDGDGKITVADALMALRIAAKLADATNDVFNCCETDGDGFVTVADALAILRVAAKLAESVEPQTITVTFNANGGSVSPKSIVVTRNSTYGSLPTPTRNDYDFVGWFTAATGGTRVLDVSTVTATSNHTLFAHWTTQQVTIPNFSGKTYSYAVDWCNSNGINYTKAEGYMWNYSSGTVVKNDYASTKVNKGSTIKIYVSIGPKPIEVGDLVYIDGDYYSNSGAGAYSGHVTGERYISLIYTGGDRAHPYCFGRDNASQYIGWVSGDCVQQRSGNTW